MTKSKCDSCVNENICKWIDDMNEAENQIAKINDMELNGPINLYVHCDSFKDKASTGLLKR